MMSSTDHADLPALLHRVTDLGLSQGDVEHIVQAPERSIREWSRGAGQASPAQLARLRELNEVAALAERVFVSMDVARAWLRRPVPGLAGESPVATLRKGDVEAVIGALSGLISGAHT